MVNHNEISDFIWGIKEHIRDEYAEKDYEDVILPFTLLRRIDCVPYPRAEYGRGISIKPICHRG